LVGSGADGTSISGQLSAKTGCIRDVLTGLHHGPASYPHRVLTRLEYRYDFSGGDLLFGSPRDNQNIIQVEVIYMF